MLADLDPKIRIPDVLAEYLEWEPQTTEEKAAGLVLALHRRWLNGAFETTISNLRAVDISVDACVEAYVRLGLSEAAGLVDRASQRVSADWDDLDEQYEQLTHGGGEADAVEAAVIRYAKSHLPAFSGADAILRR
ncbi:hypothetical protein HZF05_09050 [Sphingomonas sp. CGMCC 1.13654]|uniref:Uncharacterized protein n=1 Tax=Sphingomonas chungangi TaxID=2683589 RepID=A0A838L5E1_9SPHN|nr:hypothetical protein [Sphingomonas chungangi]MBA2934247.1 hypothetical protein [Sphingomonas chungangi]MVW57288.1 hypothetical protein [Sphingomonas chungangi]